jgi:hypothetical protein
MSKKRKINKEIRQISHFRARRLTRAVLALLLLPSLLLFGDAPLYLLIALVLFPAALNHMFQSVRPNSNRNFEEQAILTETMKTHHFVYTKYCSESVTAVLAVFILAAWQFIQPQALWYGIPYWRIPGLLIAVCYLMETIFYFYFRWRLHYRFAHINI